MVELHTGKHCTGVVDGSFAQNPQLGAGLQHQEAAPCGNSCAGAGTNLSWGGFWVAGPGIRLLPKKELKLPSNMIERMQCDFIMKHIECLLISWLAVFPSDKCPSRSILCLWLSSFKGLHYLWPWCAPSPSLEEVPRSRLWILASVGKRLSARQPSTDSTLPPMPFW